MILLYIIFRSFTEDNVMCVSDDRSITEKNFCHGNYKIHAAARN